MNERHTFSHSGQQPSRIQRDLDDYDRDTIAYLAMAGVQDVLLERVARFSGKKVPS